MRTTDDQPVITLAEAARLKGVDWASIRRAVDRGEITGYPCGKVFLVWRESVMRWTKTGHRKKKER